MKFKVGDKVKIDLTCSNSHWFTRDILTITDIVGDAATVSPGNKFMANGNKIWLKYLNKKYATKLGRILYK